MAAKKFTFKTNKPTGRFSSFDNPSHDVKLNGKEVGTINDQAPHKISLYVMKTETITDNNPNCPWKRITLKQESTSIQEAKDWLNTNFDLLNRTYAFVQD